MRVTPRPGSTRAVTGWCLEVHDLVLAKCAAGRERDWEFAEDAIRHGVVDAEELLRRVPDLPLPAADHEHVMSLLEGIVSRLQGKGDTHGS